MQEYFHHIPTVPMWIVSSRYKFINRWFGAISMYFSLTTYTGVPHCFAFVFWTNVCLITDRWRSKVDLPRPLIEMLLLTWWSRVASEWFSLVLIFSGGINVEDLVKRLLVLFRKVLVLIPGRFKHQLYGNVNIKLLVSDWKTSLGP